MKNTWLLLYEQYLAIIYNNFCSDSKYKAYPIDKGHNRLMTFRYYSPLSQGQSFSYTNTLLPLWIGTLLLIQVRLLPVHWRRAASIQLLIKIERVVKTQRGVFGGELRVV